MPEPRPARETPVPADLLGRLETAGRELSAATIAYHSALAARRGLSPSETKAIDILLRHGALTHAELVERTALAPASVTDLIDKIERKGYASRGPHPGDGRRILVTPNPEHIFAEIAPLFADWVGELQALYAEYDDDQLELISDFMKRIAARQQGAAERLG